MTFDLVTLGETMLRLSPLGSYRLEQAAQLYRESGWPAEVQGDAFTAPYSAPSAGAPPWYLYRFTFDTAFGVAGAEPHGATRWRFKR